jgi:energy-converting hydrogenase Eha subunit C
MYTCAWRIVAVVFFLAMLAALPTRVVENGPTICLFNNILGIECLGCGMIRALASILHGDVAAAISYNRLVLVVLPLLFLVLLKDVNALLSIGHRRQMQLKTDGNNQGVEVIVR